MNPLSAIVKICSYMNAAIEPARSLREVNEGPLPAGGHHTLSGRSNIPSLSWVGPTILRVGGESMKPTSPL